MMPSAARSRVQCGRCQREVLEALGRAALVWLRRSSQSVLRSAQVPLRLAGARDNARARDSGYLFLPPAARHGRSDTLRHRDDHARVGFKVESVVFRLQDYNLSIARRS